MSITMRKVSPSPISLAVILLAGAAVALCLGVYAGLHEPANRPLLHPAGFHSCIDGAVRRRPY